MEISYDPTKDARNLAKHGLSLEYGARVLVNRFGEVEDQRQDYGETRMKAFAEINGVWFQRSYAMRGTVAHIINVHRTNEREVRKWLQRSG
jgi:uncharacterized protein